MEEQCALLEFAFHQSRVLELDCLWDQMFEKSTVPNSAELLERERRLIERARHDQAALAELYRMHVERLDRYVRRRLGNTPDAEDVVANVFMSMVKNIHRFIVRDRPLMAWLYQLATNEMNRNLRRKKILRFLHLLPEVPEPRSEESCDPELVRLLLERLPVNYQSVLTLHYLEQLSLVEIGQVLNISEAAVKTRLFRGRQLFRDELLRTQPSTEVRVSGL